MNPFPATTKMLQRQWGQQRVLTLRLCFVYGAMALVGLGVCVAAARWVLSGALMVMLGLLVWCGLLAWRGGRSARVGLCLVLDLASATVAVMVGSEGSVPLLMLATVLLPYNLFGTSESRTRFVLALIPCALLLGFEFLPVLDQTIASRVEVRPQGARLSQLMVGVAVLADLLLRLHTLELVTGESERGLQAALLSAQDDARARQSFLNTVSHEIRTPMNGIQGAAQLLGHGPIDPRQRRLLRTLSQTADALLGMLQDALYDPEGHHPVRHHPFAPRQMVSDLRTLFASRTDGQAVELRVMVAPAVPRLVVGDEGKVRQVLSNLLSNALKFTSEGHVTLRVTPGPGRGEVRWEVSDTGVGMSGSVQARLFRPFEQGDRSTYRTYGGTGLGLVISRNLVERMGGRLSLRSEVGMGSSFWFDLALEAAEVPQDEQVARGGGLADARVLLAVEDPFVLEQMREVLVGWGVHVTACSTGPEAQHLLRTRMFDAGLLDLHLPGFGGLEVARGLPSPARGVPLVAMCSSVGADVRARCNQAGFVGCLARPVGPSVLYQCLTGIVGAVRGV